MNRVVATACMAVQDGLHRREFRLFFQEHDSTVLRCFAGLADGVNGFPGNRDYEVIYQLPDPLTLRIDFRVTTDRDTMISLTNHSYFNLGGSIDDHEVAINADRYTPRRPQSDTNRRDR